jgi:uncharacterized protein (TIGR00730 family)
MQSVCVYCGSRTGNRPAYAEAAQTLGRLLAERGLTLVYGAGNVGMMGLIADQVIAHGGHTVGVIPQHLVDWEVCHDNLAELHVTDDMHQRKALMADRADAFIALPGGVGTLEEIFEVAAWAQLKLHEKPMGLLNTAGYYDALNQFLDHAVAEDFIKPKHRQRLIVEREPAQLLDALTAQAGARAAER